jgi:hypothetical protein
MNFLYRIRKKHFIYAFFGIVFILFLIRLIFPSVLRKIVSAPEQPVQTAFKAAPDSIDRQVAIADSFLLAPRTLQADLSIHATDSKHKIYSVSDYQRCFPDLNDVQLVTAKRLGVPPVADRNAARYSKDEDLVYIGNNPFYYVKKLYNSIPYLVPKAQMMLTMIARNFLDSQYVKRVNPSQIIVTSMTRTKDDVFRLRQHNGNASTNSCHFYGTTFDISYNKYHPIQDPGAPKVRQTRNDTLKWILSEVLQDLRVRGVCYVKYEVHQGCYHVTVR